MGKTDSIVFYRSFYEAIEEIEDKDTKLQIYQTIFKYGLDGEEPNLKGAAKAIFGLIKPQIDANFKKRMNGRRGGRPPINQNETKAKPNNNQNKTKPEPNVNVNVNDNVNVNVNGNVNGDDAPAPESRRYGVYNNVILKDEERDALMNAYPDSYQDKIENLSSYMQSKGALYKDHYATIMKWAREDEAKKSQKVTTSNKYPPRQGSAEDLANFSNMLKEMAEERKRGGNK